LIYQLIVAAVTAAVIIATIQILEIFEIVRFAIDALFSHEPTPPNRARASGLGLKRSSSCTTSIVVLSKKEPATTLLGRVLPPSRCKAQPNVITYLQNIPAIAAALQMGGREKWIGRGLSDW
jgi:hypothetical protein